MLITNNVTLHVSKMAVAKFFVFLLTLVQRSSIKLRLKRLIIKVCLTDLLKITYKQCTCQILVEKEKREAALNY